MATAAALVLEFAAVVMVVDADVDDNDGGKVGNVVFIDDNGGNEGVDGSGNGTTVPLMTVSYA